MQEGNVQSPETPKEEETEVGVEEVFIGHTNILP